MRVPPRISITNGKAAELYRAYQHVGSRELKEILGLKEGTVNNALRYALEWGEENSRIQVDPMLTRYRKVPTDIFLEAFGIDPNKACRLAK